MTYDHERFESSQPLFELRDDGRSMSVSRVDTRTGKRLELCAPDGVSALRLDPLGLESLTWARDLGTATDRASAASEPTATVDISNEYAVVTVDKRSTDRGDVMVVTSPFLDRSRTFTVDDLEAIVDAGPTALSTRLETPFGE